MRHTRLKARPKPRLTDREAALAWFVAVTRRKGCVVCKKRTGLQAHHVVAQNVLKNEFPHGAIFAAGRWTPLDRWTAIDESDPVRTLQQLLWDPRNGVPVCTEPCHRRHTDHVALIPAASLSAAALRFAAELGLQHRLGPRYYAGGVDAAF